MNIDLLVETVRDRIVFVRSNGGKGLGFLCDYQVVTCAHVHPHLPVGFIETDLLRSSEFVEEKEPLPCMLLVLLMS